MGKTLVVSSSFLSPTFVFCSHLDRPPLRAADGVNQTCRHTSIQLLVVGGVSSSFSTTTFPREGVFKCSWPFCGHDRNDRLDSSGHRIYEGGGTLYLHPSSLPSFCPVGSQTQNNNDDGDDGGGGQPTLFFFFQRRGWRQKTRVGTRRRNIFFFGKRLFLSTPTPTQSHVATVAAAAADVMRRWRRAAASPHMLLIHRSTHAHVEFETSSHDNAPN